jgi:cell division protein FtsB
MAELDLIPSDYRRSRWQQRWLRVMASNALAMVLGMTLIYGFLTYQAADLRDRTQVLEQQRAVTVQQRAELEKLDALKRRLTQQLTVLNGLRSGAPAEMVFLTIDRALANDQLWFVDWEFRRAGVIVPEDQAQTVETGYFIVVPKDQAVGERGGWGVQTQMTIRGQALDHAALSRFVDRLFAQDAVVDVRVQRTSLRRQRETDVVEFDMTVVLNSEANA